MRVETRGAYSSPHFTFLRGTLIAAHIDMDIPRRKIPVQSTLNTSLLCGFAVISVKLQASAIRIVDRVRAKRVAIPTKRILGRTRVERIAAFGEGVSARITVERIAAYPADILPPAGGGRPDQYAKPVKEYGDYQDRKRGKSRDHDDLNNVTQFQFELVHLFLAKTYRLR